MPYRDKTPAGKVVIEPYEDEVEEAFGVRGKYPATG